MNIREMEGREILEKLNGGELSVLRHFNAGHLKDEMVGVGRVCAAAANMICAVKDDGKIRQRGIKILRMFMPSRLEGELNGSDDGDMVVIGFNHPSLGEIPRLICLGFKAFPDREFLFPVNIPWYEALVPILPKLKRMKIVVTPIITPKTENKLQVIAHGDEEMLKDIQHVKVCFERKYMRLAREFSEKKGIIFVAPSATRQQKVISDHIHPTMTLLSHMTLRSPQSKGVFLPVAVVEPEKNDRSLNLGKMYRFIACEPFIEDEVRTLSDKKRDFDLAFLKRIDKVYSKEKNGN